MALCGNGQRIGEIFSFFGIGKPTTTANNSVHIRKLILETNSAMAGKYWLTGVGPGIMQYLLRQHYFFYSISNGFFVGYYDPHSEYFTQLLSFGIGGLTLLLTIITAHFARGVRQRNLLYVYLLIVIVISFFTETVLSRQHGVIFYSLLTSLFFFYRNNESSKPDIEKTSG
jgi:hypothetical protein